MAEQPAVLSFELRGEPDLVSLNGISSASGLKKPSYSPFLCLSTSSRATLPVCQPPNAITYM